MSTVNIHTKSPHRKAMNRLLLAAGGVAAVAMAVMLRRRRSAASRLLPKGTAHARTRRVGKSQLHVTVLGQGGAPIGDLYEKVSDAQALGTLAHVRHFVSNSGRRRHMEPHPRMAPHAPAGSPPRHRILRHLSLVRRRVE